MKKMINFENAMKSGFQTLLTGKPAIVNNTNDYYMIPICYLGESDEEIENSLKSLFEYLKNRMVNGGCGFLVDFSQNETIMEKLTQYNVPMVSVINIKGINLTGILNSNVYGVSGIMLDNFSWLEVRLRSLYKGEDYDTVIESLNLKEGYYLTVELQLE